MRAEYLPLTIVSIERAAAAGAECGAVIGTIGIHGVRAAEEITAIAAEYGVRARQLAGRYDGRRATGRTGAVLAGTRAAIESVWAAVQTARGKSDTKLPEGFDPKPVAPAGPPSSPRTFGTHGYTYAGSLAFRARRERGL
jgi:hypothetical protein